MHTPAQPGADAEPYKVDDELDVAGVLEQCAEIVEVIDRHGGAAKFADLIRRYGMFHDTPPAETIASAIATLRGFEGLPL